MSNACNCCHPLTIHQSMVPMVTSIQEIETTINLVRTHSSSPNGSSIASPHRTDDCRNDVKHNVDTIVDELLGDRLTYGIQYSFNIDEKK